MTVTPEVRAGVRAAYGFACAYCGVSETLLGGELEIDHFRPLAQGGTDRLENLVYACPTCNRFKSDYWPNEDVPSSLALLHLGLDVVSEHVAAGSDGRMIGLTPRGWFHIRWLHLNRSQLIQLRLWTQRQEALQEALAQQQAVGVRLQQRILELERELAALQELISRLGTGAAP